ncbi:ParB family protein [Salmonella enterica subsp. enterica serovar Typhimurium]|nr:ParB family protein [Salmonella enterica subsp. enterica serovar Typhimurium]EIF3372480.1 ParB family protein [Salmonella enterica subsp. enterica serovar Typhimurium]EII7205887.1 ParB family protein [Salmonella enterica subsp. enterica serovar Typhimurium]EIP0078494.1 ParB family protein [Salmonella enterica subsp. enterica serovar Typhimurium]EIW9444945.1 ParB family protein [Salmonella enterica subsp. enterica serovar Typhimurium]
MSNVRNLNLGAAMLQRGKSPSLTSETPAAPLPVSEMAMVLTLDQLRPNPDNPRKSRNRHFDEIKASIRACGLVQVPKVTRDPDGEDVYIFSDGGNTRYQILCELWQETGDERFYRVHTIFKPWPGRLKCLVGHLAENEVRGDLSYIDKAFGVHNARTIQEAQIGRSVSLRELSDLLNAEGYPVHASSISRMEDTIKYLHPHMPDLLEKGLSRGQVLPILNLRSLAEKVWSKYDLSDNSSDKFERVFGEACQNFNDPDSFSFDHLRDEFIGHLVKALPHPSLNYDRWLIELDPREQKRREQFGDPPPLPAMTPPPERVTGRESPESKVAVLSPDTASGTPITGLRSGTLTTPGRPEPAPELPAGAELPVSAFVTAGSEPRREVQNDLFGGRPVISGETADSDSISLPDFSPGTLMSAFGEENESPAASVSSVAFAATGLEPVSDIWHIPALQDDIEHLQDMAYRLVFEIAEVMGCADNVREDKHPQSAGFAVSETGSEFVLFLAGLSGSLPNRQFNMFMFCLNFFGSQSPADMAVFDDITVVKTMRLFRVIRRLRELQRLAAKGGENV